MITIDSNLTKQIDKAINSKKWNAIEKILNDISLQFYHPDKIALIGLCLLEELKNKG